MKFRKKPVVIEAMRLTHERGEQVAQWCGGDPIRDPLGRVDFIEISTLEGRMTARVGDWIIKGVQGEFYPCKPDIFEATYEPLKVSVDCERCDNGVVIYYGPDNHASQEPCPDCGGTGKITA